MSFGGNRNPFWLRPMRPDNPASQLPTSLIYSLSVNVNTCLKRKVFSASSTKRQTSSCNVTERLVQASKMIVSPLVPSTVMLILYAPGIQPCASK